MRYTWQRQHASVACSGREAPASISNLHFSDCVEDSTFPGRTPCSKQPLQEMKGEERMVAHFYRSSLPCQVMDKHLALLAGKHMETKFVKVHAEKAPFLTGAFGAGQAWARMTAAGSGGFLHQSTPHACFLPTPVPLTPPLLPSPPAAPPAAPPASPTSPPLPACAPQSGSRSGCCPRWRSSSTRKQLTMWWAWMSWAAARTSPQVAQSDCFGGGGGGSVGWTGGCEGGLEAADSAAVLAGCPEAAGRPSRAAQCLPWDRAVEQRVWRTHFIAFFCC